MSDPEMVSVRIQGSVTLNLDQTVKMTKQEFDRLNAIYDSEDGLGVDDAEQFLEHLELTEPVDVDYNDVDLFELVDKQ